MIPGIHDPDPEPIDPEAKVQNIRWREIEFTSAIRHVKVSFTVSGHDIESEMVLSCTPGVGWVCYAYQQPDGLSFEQYQDVRHEIEATCDRLWPEKN